MKKIVQIVWLVAGVLAIVIFTLGISAGVNVYDATKDIKELWAQVELSDIRQAINIIEKQLDTDLLELQIEHQRLNHPLEWTIENWQGFLDFCGRTGYVVSDENWQRYRCGKLWGDTYFREFEACP